MITISDSHIQVGFFSKLGIVLDWVHNCIYENENININWNNNLWDTLFEQPLITSNDTTNRNLNVYHFRFYHKQYYNGITNVIPNYHTYNGTFWNTPKIFFDNLFQNVRDEYNKAWNKIKIKNHVNDSVNEYLNSFGEKTLGVSVRIPLHYTFDRPGGLPISAKIHPEYFYKIISEEIEKEYYLNGYDKIFIACDIQYFINLMIEKFGEDKIIFTKYNRINSLNYDWETKQLPLQEEYFNILIDALLLTKCDLLMGGSSNIFVGCLFINNKIPYKVFDTLSEVYGC